MLVSSALSFAALFLAFDVPSRYYMSPSYDPFATWQARVSSVLIVCSAALLVLGFVATVRSNQLREDEPGYSTWGALLGTVLPFFLLALAVVARHNAG